MRGVRRKLSALAAIPALILSSCGGGGSSGGSGGSPAPTPGPTLTGPYAAPAQEALTSADVQAVVANAVAEAQARNLPAVIAVTDRVGNVLAVYAMAGAPATAAASAAPNGQNMDVQGQPVPAAAAAIAKAITGAYLSSSGNAFSTRTASEIVQEHFPPGSTSTTQPAGPLFGVQFSQLPCSDLNTRLDDPRYPAAGNAMIGPRRSPLGLAADPGGFPLYKNGVVVGGVGVMEDGVYGLDADVFGSRESDPEEAIALAATKGFAADPAIRADQISAGVLLEYSNTGYGDLPSRATVSISAANLVSVTGYYDAAAGFRAGVAYGVAGSGYRPVGAAEFPRADAFVLTDAQGNNRFPIRGGTDVADLSAPLTAAEVTALLEEAFKVMARARGQIRRPANSQAQVTISVVDSRGEALGLVRSPDAPVFGTDVSLQKARTAAFFSHPQAGATLAVNPSGDVQAFKTAGDNFLGAGALTGNYAFTARAHGNLSRPFYPDGSIGQPNGPFSRPIAQFNPFSTGLQSALVIGNLVEHLTYVLSGGTAADTAQRCTATSRLANGIQIFPGAVPIYRGNILVGAIGVSGDGVDQDDMISFLGLSNAGLRVGGIGNAPVSMRSDILAPLGIGLRYAQCPVAPFLDSNQQQVCNGL